MEIIIRYIMISMGRPKKKILAIDDEAPMLALLKRLLEPEDYDVITTQSGKEGLAICEREAIDLLLLDIDMSEMSGLDVLIRLRERHPLMPVIMLTASQNEVVALTAMRLGAFDYIMKPFNIDQFKLTIKAKLL